MDTLAPEVPPATATSPPPALPAAYRDSVSPLPPVSSPPPYRDAVLGEASTAALSPLSSRGAPPLPAPPEMDTVAEDRACRPAPPPTRLSPPSPVPSTTARVGEDRDSSPGLLASRDTALCMLRVPAALSCMLPLLALSRVTPRTDTVPMSLPRCRPSEEVRSSTLTPGRPEARREMAAGAVACSTVAAVREREVGEVSRAPPPPPERESRPVLALALAQMPTGPPAALRCAVPPALSSRVEVGRALLATLTSPPPLSATGPPGAAHSTELRTTAPSSSCSTPPAESVRAEPGARLSPPPVPVPVASPPRRVALPPQASRAVPPARLMSPPGMLAAPRPPRMKMEPTVPAPGPLSTALPAPTNTVCPLSASRLTSSWERVCMKPLAAMRTRAEPEGLEPRYTSPRPSTRNSAAVPTPARIKFQALLLATWALSSSRVEVKAVAAGLCRMLTPPASAPEMEKTPPPAPTASPPASTDSPPASTSTPPLTTSTPPAPTLTPPASTSSPPAAISVAPLPATVKRGEPPTPSSCSSL